ncbi:MAG: hypothetical protein HYX79_10115 [Chloroflexi bacterium]|nr:hypothetical protein [Chloroflexota bacterium]
MDKNEKAKLKTLLNYWLEHNKEHGDEFKEWADRAAKASRDVKLATDLAVAGAEMDKVNEHLSNALKKLG